MPVQAGGFSDEKIHFHSSNESVAEVLSRAGFRTSAFSDNIMIHPLPGFDQGFDRFEINYKFPFYCWRSGENLTI